MLLETRNLWAQVPAVHLLGNILVRTTTQGQDVQLVLPQCIWRQLFDMTHSGNLAAHLGAERTLLQLVFVHGTHAGWGFSIGKSFRTCPLCKTMILLPVYISFCVVGRPDKISTVTISRGAPIMTIWSWCRVRGPLARTHESHCTGRCIYAYQDITSGGRK